MRYAAPVRAEGAATIVADVGLVTWFGPLNIFGDGVFHAQAALAALPATERHANATTVLVTAVLEEYLFRESGVGIAHAEAHAAIRLLRMIDELPEGVATRGKRLAAYAIVSNALSLRVVRLDVVWVANAVFGVEVPAVRCTVSERLPLWSPPMMSFAYGHEHGEPHAAAPAHGSELDAAHPPAGLMMLVHLLQAGRDVLGIKPDYLPEAALTFVPPTDATTAVTLPPREAWYHLGRGGTAEVYEVDRGGGVYAVVKMARNRDSTCQALGEEVGMYAALGAGGGCPAIPTVLAVAHAPPTDDTASISARTRPPCAITKLTALVLHPGARIAATSPVLDVLSTSKTRVLDALLATYSVILALEHAHARDIVHRDLRAHNVVWITRQTPPAPVTVGNVERAIAAAEAGGDPTLFVPVHAQLVDWGVALPIKSSKATGKWDWLGAGVSVQDDLHMLSFTLLPVLLNVLRFPREEDDLVGIVADKLCLPAVLPLVTSLMKSAKTARDALVAVLRLLRVAVQSTPAAAVPAAAAAPRHPRAAAAAAAAAIAAGAR